MSDPLDSSNSTVEQSLSKKWGETKNAVESYLQDGEAFVREEPLKAVAYAAAAGYVLRILPLGSIVRTVVRVALTAVKPVAVVYGAAKAYEIIVKSKV